MSSQREERKKKRMENQNPINYTCGECKQVHKYDSVNPYICENKIGEEAE